MLDSLHVLDGEIIGAGVGDASSTAFILRIHPVRSDGLNLVQQVLLAGETNGGDQDQGGGADDHAERGQGKADLIAHEGLVGEAEDLAEGEVSAVVWRGGAIHLPS